MPPRDPCSPTDAQLAILNVLWARGPSTVRDVHEALTPDDSRGYTTTLKLMQVMVEKGLVRRDETHRSHVYAAEVSQDRTQKQLLRELQKKAFGGSAASLVMRALSDRPASTEEIAAIRRLLDRLESGKGESRR
jgi:predicted transcriptional regulator